MAKKFVNGSNILDLSAAFLKEDENTIILREFKGFIILLQFKLQHIMDIKFHGSKIK